MAAAGETSESAAALIVNGSLIIPYRYALGQVASRFYVELRDHQRLMAIRCGDCGRAYLPPVATCIDCFAATTEWTEVGPAGTVRTCTVVRRRELKIHPGPVPLIYALIRLDGADSDLLHLLGDVSPEEVRIGMRVRAVFTEDRQGNILDIKHFAPEGAG